MRKTIVFILFLALVISLPSFAGSVRGYTRKNGTYVAPHKRSNPDRSYNNNYSTKGNTNPHTGKKGTHSKTGENKP